jgi:diaminopimelate decarboxylase
MAANPWWRREGLDVVEGRLRFAGHDAEAIAREHGTPLYVYDPERAAENVRRMQRAFQQAKLPHRVHFAVKSNRHPAYLTKFRSMGNVGIDVCSPQEVTLALQAGWKPEEISYTGTNLSDRDLDVILAQPLILNLDSLSAIRRVGQRARGRAIGLRVNPQIGTGYSAQLTYSGEKPTKFGIYTDRFEEALALAREQGLDVQGLHFHIGSGWLREGLETFLAAVARGAELARRVPGLR